MVAAVVPVAVPVVSELPVEPELELLEPLLPLDVELPDEELPVVEPSVELELSLLLPSVPLLDEEPELEPVGSTGVQAPQPKMSTSATQTGSHPSVQQTGSEAQTHDCTSTSEQPRPPCGSQQPPSPWHTAQPKIAKSVTHCASHSSSQQKVSMSQTHSSITGSPHPGASEASQQLGAGSHWPHPSDSTSAAHCESHWDEQQLGSRLQTHPATVPSPQLGPCWATQQLPEPGSAPVVEAAVSLAEALAEALADGLVIEALPEAVSVSRGGSPNTRSPQPAKATRTTHEMTRAEDIAYAAGRLMTK